MSHISVVLLAICATINIVHSGRLADLYFANSDVLEFKHGGGKEFDNAKYSSQGEKGDKGYQGHHEVEKGAKGYHDREGHKKQYAEVDGNSKGYNHNDGYYGQQHKGEKGRKGYHYQDKGSYAKGHSTKGRHNVHKLDEYKKNTDFYDEDHDAAVKENHGGFEEKKAVSVGELLNGGHFKKVYLAGDFGQSGKSDKGSHYSDSNGFNKAAGQDGFYINGADFGKQGNNNQFQKYAFIVRH